MYHYKTCNIYVLFILICTVDTEIYGTASLHLYAVGGRCSVPLSVQTSHYLIRQTTIGLLSVNSRYGNEARRKSQTEIRPTAADKNQRIYIGSEKLELGLWWKCERGVGDTMFVFIKYIYTASKL